MFDIRGFPHPMRDGVYSPPSRLTMTFHFGHRDRSGATTTLRVAFSRAPSEVVDMRARKRLSAPEHARRFSRVSIRRSEALPPKQAPGWVPRRSSRSRWSPSAAWELLVTLTPGPLGDTADLG